MYSYSKVQPTKVKFSHVLMEGSVDPGSFSFHLLHFSHFLSPILCADAGYGGEMSAGDGQPRKRKDKRRKKEEEEIYPQLKHPSDEVIHVHKESGLGGNICAKIVFFFLLSAIAVIVGLILVEYRGTTDDNASHHKSAWSVAFQDWSNLLALPDLVPQAFKGESGESRKSYKEDEIDDDGGGGDAEETSESAGWFSFGFGGGGDVDSDVEDAVVEQIGSSWFDFFSVGNDETREAEIEERDESGELKEDENESGEMDQGDEDEQEDEDKSEEQDEIDGESQEDEEEETKHEEEEEEEETEEQIYQSLFRRRTYPDDESVEAPDDEDGPEDEVDDEPAHVDEDEEEEEEEEDLFPEALEALRKEASELLKEQAQELEEAKEAEESDDRDESEDDQREIGNEEEAEGMALKFGIGVALIVVAHVVLVRKWNSWAESETQLPTEPAQAPAASFVPSEPIQSPPIVSPSSPIPDPVKVSPVSQPPVSDSRREKPEVSGDEEEDEEEDEELVDEELEEEEEEELSDDEPPINPGIYEELLAKYGQPTPESSDAEASEKEYSEGAEESVGEEEESEPDEEDGRQWTTINKHQDYETESEDGSDIEVPEVPQTRPKTGGKDVDDYETYANAEITNEEDWAIRKELDEADQAFNMDKIEAALHAYQRLLSSSPKSPRALYGVARSLDRLAEVKQSNVMLQKSIDGYLTLLDVGSSVPDVIFRQAAQRAINRIRFKGMYMKAIPVHELLIERFNDSVEYRMDLAINYLMVNRLENGEKVLSEILSIWADHDSARAHYGLVLKLQGQIEDSIPHLTKGLARDSNETRDARLYFHLGDALTRTGRRDEAAKVYESGVKLGLFKSVYQRSLYNVDRLTARPWWTLAETTYETFFRKLEANWRTIREEGLGALKLRDTFMDEAESLRHLGDWKQFQLFARGAKQAENCKKTPVTCRLLGDFKAAGGCRRGQSKFSVMEGGTHVWPHCGPTNCRLRGHLGLVVPQGPSIRVGDVTKYWQEGKVMVFDDSFEHEVWHNGTQLRLVLIVDVWHPELTKHEKATLSSI